MRSYIILADETTSKSHKFYVYLRIFFQHEAGQVELGLEMSEGGGKVPGQPVKTHRIVINLDDKNRFTDEVTV